MASAHATEFTVSKTADTNDGTCDADCSLREAVLAANSGPGHVITIPAGTYRLTLAPAATDPENGTKGSLFVNRPVAINGAGRATTIIDARPSDGAQGIDRVLLVGPLGEPTITGVTLRGGRVASGSPRNVTGGFGGGVWVQRGAGSGTVTFVDSAITDNTVTQSGGGLLVQKSVVDDGADDLVLLRTEVLRNKATDANLGQGAGIWASHSNVRIEDSTIDGNVAATQGGGVMQSETQNLLDANLTIRGSTISNNIAGLNGTGGAPLIGGSGGGISNSGGAMLVENSTITGNEARQGTLPIASGQGGGVYNLPTMSNPKTTQLTNCTVAYNDGNIGSQLYAAVISNSSGLLLANTLLVGADGGDPNCPASTPGGTATVSLGGNISSDTSPCNLDPDDLGDQVGADNIGLAPALENNGGPTLTLSLQEEGPAVAAGLPLHCPVTDQRGFGRPLPCSVGAFEAEDIPLVECGDASEAIGGGVGIASGRAVEAAPRAIGAGDALIVLRASVGSVQCVRCVCDVNNSGGTTAADALIVLRYGVGQAVVLNCPPCN